VVNISSGGLLFHADRPLPMGHFLQAVIAWPAIRENRRPMQLSIQGQIVRTDGKATAVAITKSTLRAT
jgi:hypothetical protein